MFGWVRPLGLQMEIQMVTIEGTIQEIIFANETNGYTVCEVEYGDDTVTAVGYMPFISIGEMLRLSGKWMVHPDYGQQLKVEMYEKMMPQSLEAIEKYLASGILPGVGPVTAKKIVEVFGEETLNIIQFRPDSLVDVKGISLEKARKIGQAYQEQRGLTNVIMFFQDYGISTTMAAKIYKEFGENTIQEIKANPYRLSDEIIGIGFKTADRIAQNLGIDPASEYRISSGIQYVLSQGAVNGHTYMPESRLRENTVQLLNINLESILNSLVKLTLDKAVCVDKEQEESHVYLASLFYAELGVCRKLGELAEVAFNQNLDGLEESIERIQQEEGITLAIQQKVAIKEAVTNGVLVITGGPGTGKTTIIKTIIRLLLSEGYKIELAAPTGRAAKRMSEATGYEARTIHRLLEMGYAGDEENLVFLRGEENPLEADVVIIDETSMVDIVLMNHLLKSIASGTRLILVGDVDQLPSVGPGNVLKDIISSGKIRTVKLTEIFRQAQQSMITVNAHKINKGDMPVLNAKNGDFFFMGRNTPEAIIQTVIELCTRRLPDFYGVDPMKDIQVLTPTRKGPAGVVNLNIELQKHLNPPAANKSEKLFKEFVFREGDRVMQIKNNYNLRWIKADRSAAEGMGVFNGDMGIITKISEEERRLTVLTDDDKLVEYDYTILEELEPAFAITIHKSQGSEFNTVILPLFPGPQVLMTRNLLYTAVTRARCLVVLVGQTRVLEEMVRNERETQRYSALGDKLRLLCF